MDSEDVWQRRALIASDSDPTSGIPHGVHRPERAVIIRNISRNGLQVRCSNSRHVLCCLAAGLANEADWLIDVQWCSIAAPAIFVFTRQTVS